MLHSEFIPATEPRSRQLMVMLHGLGDSVEGFRWLPEAMGLPWLNYLLVNAPDEYYGGYAWYDFNGNTGADIQRSCRLLGELLDAQRTNGFPTGQTVLAGFSQGSLMSVEVAMRYPHRFAGIVGISGHIWQPEQLVEELSPVALEQRLLITHGTLDSIIPFAITREQVNVLKAAGLHIEWHELVKAHTIAGEPELEIIREFVRGMFAFDART